MASKVSKGSIILEILIVLLSLLLVAVILVPNKIWQEENQITAQCRDNMNGLNEAEAFYFRAQEQYTDSLSKLLTFIQADSGLQQRQKLVSLTRSFLQVVHNILEIPSVQQISALSQAAYEISGDLVGNERYFRKYENILERSQEILRDIEKFDSSSTFPNFCKTKLYIDSLKNLKDKVSDFSLQNGILHSIGYVDSIDHYFPNIEREVVNQFWQDESQKINNFIGDIKKTDISKVSNVPDRLKKFSDRITSSLQYFNSADISQERQKLVAERQNLDELHQKFLSPEFFILTQRYGLEKLNETDSILVHLNQNDFYCPDCRELYLIDTTGGKHLTVECPNLLDTFHKRFVDDVSPIQNLPLFSQMDSLDTIIARTRAVLNDNRIILRRKTDLLLDMKEIMAEFDDLNNVFLYRYAKDVGGFVKMIQTEKKLSVLKPAIEDVLNPMDTLATRIEKQNVADLSKKVMYFQSKLARLDSMVATIRLSRRLRTRYHSSLEPFQSAVKLIVDIKAKFKPEDARALRETSKKLEKELLHALEGVKETKYVIFYKRHINHGFIKDGEKSWEEK